MTTTTNTVTANANLSKETAPTPLRICCYGSSSSRTPTKYTSAAYTLGNLLAKRGHTCVNGAGSSGCMAAMNHGAHDGNGHIVGVIHEKFVVDGSDWFEGAHSVFREGSGNEILVARGNDLQERKKLLVKDADALVVLPGGPGTWDELWEMACSRHIGFHSMPIVCVNIHGYYDNFKVILNRAHEDQLLYKHPKDIVHFEETPEAAVKWIETYLADPANIAQKKVIKKRPSTMLNRLQSNISGSSLSVWGRMTSFFGDEMTLVQENDDNKDEATTNRDGIRSLLQNLVVFSAGLTVGLLIASSSGMKSRSIRS